MKKCNKKLLFIFCFVAIAFCVMLRMPPIEASAAEEKEISIVNYALHNGTYIYTVNDIMPFLKIDSLKPIIIILAAALFLIVTIVVFCLKLLKKEKKSYMDDTSFGGKFFTSVQEMKAYQKEIKENEKDVQSPAQQPKEEENTVLTEEECREIARGIKETLTSMQDTQATILAYITDIKCITLSADDRSFLLNQFRRDREKLLASFPEYNPALGESFNKYMMVEGDENQGNGCVQEIVKPGRKLGKQLICKATVLRKNEEESGAENNDGGEMKADIGEKDTQPPIDSHVEDKNAVLPENGSSNIEQDKQEPTESDSNAKGETEVHQETKEVHLSVSKSADDNQRKKTGRVIAEPVWSLFDHIRRKAALKNNDKESRGDSDEKNNFRS